MSGTSLLDQYMKGKRPERDEDTGTPGSETTEDLGSYGYLRGVRDRAVMLELVKKDGTIRAVGYAWLERIDFDPSGAITLHAAGQKIVIRGRNLNGETRPQIRLFSGLARHRVTWIREADEPALMKAGEGETVIEGIEW